MPPQKIKMGKLKTTLVNDTSKTLQLFDQTSNVEYTWRDNLLGRTGSPPNRNVTVETTDSSPRQTNIVGEADYLVESDPNQTYWTLSVWLRRDVVLSMGTEELIDSVVTLFDGTRMKRSSQNIANQGPPAAMVPDTPRGEASPAPPPHSKVSWWRSIFRRNKH